MRCNRIAILRVVLTISSFPWGASTQVWAYPEAAGAKILSPHCILTTEHTVDSSAAASGVSSPPSNHPAVMLRSHLRLIFPRVAGRDLNVVVGWSSDMNDVTLVGLVVGGCLWWMGGRPTEAISADSQAIPIWNAAFDSAQINGVAVDSMSARILAIAWLVSATGRPILTQAYTDAIEFKTRNYPLSGLEHWRGRVATAVYREHDTWIVSGRWEQRSATFLFKVVVTQAGRLRNYWIQPQN